MAKSRAQRKADRRKREEQLRQRARESQAKAREASPATVEEQDAEVAEADFAEADFDVAESESHEATRPTELGDVGPIDPVVESELVSAEPVKRSRREERREAKERERRARESAKRREGTTATVKERGAVAGFFASVSRELQRVQWPDRETLIQASGVTLLFVAIAAAYLGALDAAFNQLIRWIL